MAENKSVASNHFPQIVWRDGKKHLWNPIHRHALKNLPEERVRLRVLEYLLHGGWSKHRISTEEAIDLPQKEANMRTDLICYTRDFKPLLLVECKAENITLSGKTAKQIARYNQGVNAPYMLMTNGRSDLWYALKDETSAKPLQGIPVKLPMQQLPEIDFGYWQSRGFAGSSANHELRSWGTKFLKRFFRDETQTAAQHLTFNSSPGDVNMINYYKIFFHSDHRLALGFTATPYGGSRCVGILNREGKNEAVLEINLDFLFDERAPNASIYWSGDTKNIDIRNFTNILPVRQSDFQTLVSDLSNIFFNTIY